MQGVEIKMTEKKGRGVFATKNISKGELIFIEKAIAFSYKSEHKVKTVPDLVLVQQN